MAIMAPNLAEHALVFRVEETELIPIDLLNAKPLSFMAKPGAYLIEPTL